jgi:LuxR family maltose regulon positive regulatory protein
LTDSLTPRELEVLHLLGNGFSNREIARELVLALGTVKSHVHRIYSKLDVKNRTQTVARARELKLL